VIMACRNMEAAESAKQKIVHALAKEGMTDVEDRIKVRVTNSLDVQTMYSSLTKRQVCS
jgi:hypothetical protein